MWTHHGKEEEGGQTYNGKMRVRGYDRGGVREAIATQLQNEGSH